MAGVLQASRYDEYEKTDSKTLLVYDFDTIASRFSNLRQSAARATFYIFRHAETVSNAEGLVTGSLDVDLTDQGRKAALAIGSHLPQRIDFAVCSGLKRTQDTALLALSTQSHSSVRIYIDSRLNEVSLGTLEGVKRHWIREFEAGDIDFQPPAGESYRLAARRVLSAFADYAGEGIEDSLNSSVVMFVHAGVMRILATLKGHVVTSEQMFGISYRSDQCLRIDTENVVLQEFWRKDLL